MLILNFNFGKEWECLPKCMYVYYVYLVPRMARKHTIVPGTGIIDGCGYHKCWELIPAHLLT